MCQIYVHVQDGSLKLETNSALPRIRNVISTADLKQPVNVRMFKQYSWGRYDTEIYGGKCGYIKDISMKGRVTIFLSGKMISTGADGISRSLKQLNQTKTLLLKEGLIRDVVLNPTVQNIVATIDLGSRLDFSEALQNLSNYVYEPETFSGIIHRTAAGPTALIFSSGKIVIVGSKSEQVLHVVAKDLRLAFSKFICN